MAHQHEQGCDCGEHEHGCGCGEHHEHEAGCGCGEHHEHQEHGCGCGEHHTHEHGCGCGEHHHESAPHSAEVTDGQAAFLQLLAQRHFLPLARFVAKSSKEGSFSTVMLEPVFIRSAADDMETVKEAGAFLTQLAEKELITLDYDMPLGSYGYDEYHGSALYAYFCETVRASVGKPGFLSDTPTLELGSIALTEHGERVIGV